MNRWLLGLFVLSLAACAAWAQAPEGELLYKGYCAACHDQPLLTRAPGRPLLEKIPPEGIVRALISGSMAAMGDALSAAQRETLGRFLSKTPSRPKMAMSGACTTAEAKLASIDSLPWWNGWGVNVQN